MKTIKSMANFYNKLSNSGKILVLIAVLLILIVFFKAIMPVKEGMVTTDKFLFKQGEDVYDDFYVGIYDYLVFNGIRND